MNLQPPSQQQHKADCLIHHPQEGKAAAKAEGGFSWVRLGRKAASDNTQSFGQEQNCIPQT